MKKLSDLIKDLQGVIEEQGDINVADLLNDDVPLEIAERVVRDVDLTLLPEGDIYASTDFVEWVSDDVERGTKTDILEVLGQMAYLMQDEGEHPSDRESARACLQRVADYLREQLG